MFPAPKRLGPTKDAVESGDSPCKIEFSKPWHTGRHALWAGGGVLCQLFLPGDHEP
jgi:hypothetical protein